MTDHLIAAFAEDIDVRTNGFEYAKPNGYQSRSRDKARRHLRFCGSACDSHPSGTRELAACVRIPLRHANPLCCNLRDTRESTALERASVGVDVLVHEVAVLSLIDSPPGLFHGNVQRYMRSFHTPDKKLGELASRAKPKLLVLSHVVPNGVPDSVLIAGIRSGGYTGKIAVGHDLDRYLRLVGVGWQDFRCQRMLQCDSSSVFSVWFWRAPQGAAIPLGRILTLD